LNSVAQKKPNCERNVKTAQKKKGGFWKKGDPRLKSGTHVKNLSDGGEGGGESKAPLGEGRDWVLHVRELTLGKTGRRWMGWGSSEGEGRGGQGGGCRREGLGDAHKGEVQNAAKSRDSEKRKKRTPRRPKKTSTQVPGQ